MRARKADREAEPVELLTVARRQLLRLCPGAASVGKNVDSAARIVHADGADDRGVALQGNGETKLVVCHAVVGEQFLHQDPLVTQFAIYVNFALGIPAADGGMRFADHGGLSQDRRAISEGVIPDAVIGNHFLLEEADPLCKRSGGGRFPTWERKPGHE